MNAEQYENYAHKNAPHGIRFVGVVGQTPPWAVDVQPGDGKVRNAYGLEVHVTDKYVPAGTPQVTAVQVMMTMREIWYRAQADRASEDDILFMIDVVTQHNQSTAKDA